MPVDEHGNEYDEEWKPDSPVLRGEVRTPDRAPDGGDVQPDELPHRVRREQGLDTPDPDPGYDPTWDDLV